MFQIHLARSAYEIDNATVFCKLKLFLIDGPGWAYIESFDVSENGQAAFASWTDQYNGQGKLSKKSPLPKLSSRAYSTSMSPAFLLRSSLKNYHRNGYRGSKGRRNSYNQGTNTINRSCGPNNNGGHGQGDIIGVDTTYQWYTKIRTMTITLHHNKRKVTMATVATKIVAALDVVPMTDNGTFALAAHWILTSFSTAIIIKQDCC
eukprot:7867900-Ditylum_brightwellii.AAC.1